MTDARAFRGFRFPPDVILWAVRWYLQFPVSYRDLEAMLADRGVAVDHTTMYRWVQRFAPELEKRTRRHLRPCRGPWHVDETYVRVAGRWRYLYRAVDGTGQTIDFLLGAKRDKAAARRFFRQALGRANTRNPREIVTDRLTSYPGALRGMKRDGELYYSGVLVGILTQWQLGGDIARTVRLAHQTRERAKVVVSIVYEKLAGFAATGLMAIAAAMLLHSRHPLASTGLVVAAAGFAITALAAVPVCAASGPVVRWLASLGSSRMANLGQDIERVVDRGDTLRRATLVFFLLTLAEQSMPLVTIYLTQRALGFDLAPLELLAVVPIIIFFSRLPLSVDGIGVYEGLMVLLFGLMGMTATQAFALAITSRVAGLVSVTLGTGVCLAIHRYVIRA